MVWIDIISKVLPVLLLLLLGFFLKKINYLSDETLNDLKKIVVNIALPALLFSAFLNTDFQLKYIWIILIVFGVNFLMLFLSLLLSRGLKIANPYYSLMFTGFETGMLGFSLFGAVYGVSNIGFLGIIDLGQELYVWFVLVALLTMRNDESPDITKIGRSFLTSPVIIGIVSGVFLNIVGLRIFIGANPITNGLLITVSMISQLVIPLILIVIGSQLSFKFKEFNLPLKTIIPRYFLLIILALGINRFIFQNVFHLPGIFSTALFVMFVLPPPFIIPLFMNNTDEESRVYVNNALSLGSLVTVIIFLVSIFMYR